MSPSGPAPTEPALFPDFEPEDVRYIGDVETLRAISDATRMRILETMVQRRSPAWSVKELAAALEMPQTRLYHHVELLLERDLIRPTERRVVSGIIETRYSVAALSFQLDRSLFATDQAAGLRGPPRDARWPCSTPPAPRWSSRSASATIKPDAGPSDEHTFLLTRGLTRLTTERAAELRGRLQALLEEFDDTASEDPAAHAVRDRPRPLPDAPRRRRRRHEGALR